MSERKEAVRADLEPGFWCEYVAPTSHVAAEVQRPSHMVNGETLAVAYMRDWRQSRSVRPESDDK